MLFKPTKYDLSVHYVPEKQQVYSGCLSRAPLCITEQLYDDSDEIQVNLVNN